MEFPAIGCCDLQGLINKVIETRKRERYFVLLKICIDGGGEFLQISISVFDRDDPIPNKSGTLSKKFIESGGKKIVIIGLIRDVPEDYANVKRLWIHCDVGYLRNYTVATDLKLCNMLLLMMIHSFCHLFFWSDHTKDAFH